MYICARARNRSTNYSVPVLIRQAMAKQERLRFLILKEIILLQMVVQENPYEELQKWTTIIERLVE